MLVLTLVSIALAGHAPIPAPVSPAPVVEAPQSLDRQVEELAARVRAGEGAAAHQLGDLALERGHVGLATAWYLEGAELGDADARGHLEWMLPQLDEGDWQQVDRGRARIQRWLDGPRPQAWLPLEATSDATTRSGDS